MRPTQEPDGYPFGRCARLGALRTASPGWQPVGMAKKFNPAPGWPAPPEGWVPPDGWQPDMSWPPAPAGWQLWVEELEPGVLWQGQSQTMTGAATGGRGAAKYKLTNHYLHFEKGLLKTDAQQVPIANVLDVDVKQSMTQKARGVGDVIVHIQRPMGTEKVTLEALKDFREAQRIINETAHAARAAASRMQNTHHYTSQSVPQEVAPAAPAAPAPTPGPAAPQQDVMAQIKQLGELKEAGILTEEEFQAKKTDLLTRL